MTFANLPETCFVVLKSTNEVVMVTRGERGYSPTREGNLPWYGQETADILNANRGISKAQASAMEWGSFLGFDNKMANPAMYDEEGKPKQEMI